MHILPQERLVKLGEDNEKLGEENKKLRSYSRHQSRLAQGNSFKPPPLVSTSLTAEAIATTCSCV